MAPYRISIINVSAVCFSFRRGNELHNSSLRFFEHLHTANRSRSTELCVAKLWKNILRASGLDTDGWGDENWHSTSPSVVHLRNNRLSHDSAPNFRPIMSKSKNTRTMKSTNSGPVGPRIWPSPKAPINLWHRWWCRRQKWQRYVACRNDPAINHCMGTVFPYRIQLSTFGLVNFSFGANLGRLV